ncbi:n-acetylglutamate synthase [Gracilimonas mengyeensis]|nr:n-acetylglutamate synthase [Gracilimonas mengyeensis]
MTTINYNNRKFRSVENTSNGDVSGETLFHYRQKGDAVWATYEGGNIHFGTLTAKVGADNHLEMRYSHVNTDGELKTGKCHSSPKLLPDGRLRLHEKWQWTGEDQSSGESIIEEVRE